MIDATHTTHDWQMHSGEICVLPVGSCEQHSHHLPLDTDITGADFFARIIAEDLNAALLPPLPFGTCMEHSGFRGSISLRPETLMQVIRDIADEVERQSFHVLLIMNGHGGNFALGPVVRDINRIDRTLKVLLVDWWEFLNHEIAADSKELGIDLHAGEMETSFMLAIAPDSVRPDSIDRASGKPERSPLNPRDLNTFGMGHFSATGAVGYPSFASAAKGEAIINSIRERMLPHVRDRIRRLKEQPRYAGSGGLAIRAMSTADIAAGMELKTLSGWNQTEDDWNLFLREAPDGCFVAIQNGRVVGTATAIRYGEELAWIGMMLVHPDFRRMGLGKLLLERAIESAQKCRSIKLDATPLGKELYDKMEFVDKYSLHRLTHSCVPQISGEISDEVVPITDAHWQEISTLDRQVFGADRLNVLKTLHTSDQSTAFCVVRQDRVQGFCLGRRGTNFYQVGPVVAASAEDAIILIQAAFHNLIGRAIVLDVPDAQSDFLQWLSRLGFVKQRPFIRMVRGGNAPDSAEQMFTICGPELG
jgi:creatinine amidohydrolase/Fe(II)-dependent formamide hydrolase-like protein